LVFKKVEKVKIEETTERTETKGFRNPERNGVSFEFLR
jgi:hypothetical protein